MATSRQSTSSTSSTGESFSAPGTYAQAQTDIQLYTEVPQAANTGVTGFGGTTTYSAVIPINQITESSTTATVYTASQLPSWITTSSTVVLTNCGAYSGSYTVASFSTTNLYQFTITATAGLGTVGSPSTGAMTCQFNGGVSASVNAPAAPQYAAALNGQTIRGSAVTNVEIWGDHGFWDTANNRPLGAGVDFPVNGF